MRLETAVIEKADERTRQDPAAPEGWADAPEARCLEAAREGRSEAFAELVRRYTGPVYGMLRRLVGNREDAEDLTQETFLRAYKSLHRFDEARPFRNWLFTIAMNAGRNALRSRRRRGYPVSIEDDAQAAVLAAPAKDDGRHRAERGEVRDRVERTVARLPDRAATLVHLHYTEGLSLREAGAVLGMSEGAAKVALCRARQQLREWMEEDLHHDL